MHERRKEGDDGAAGEQEALYWEDIKAGLRRRNEADGGVVEWDIRQGAEENEALEQCAGVGDQY